MADLQKLHVLFAQRLSVGPFPTEDCAKARVTGKTHAELLLYLADIAGIASRGDNLTKLDDVTRQSFLKIAANGWWEKHPDTVKTITPQATPKLYQLISATEEARNLILLHLGH